MEKFKEMPISIWQLIPSYERIKFSDCPKSIPMEMLDEETAKRNHTQDLQTLSNRGGLSPQEALAIMDKSSFYRGERNYRSIGMREAVDELKRRLEEHNKK